MDTPGDRDERILLLAPVGRDAALASATLRAAEIATRVCADIAEVCREVVAGAGGLLLTQEALSADAVGRLLDLLGAQPPWSDLPLIVLVAGDSTAPAPAPPVAALGQRANATFLERPVRAATLQIDELVDLTRLQADRPLPLAREPTDLAALARRGAAEYRHLAPRRAIRVVTPPAALVGAWDPRRLERVLGNLLANALKYSPDDSEVTIEVGREEGPVPGAVLAVRDRGTGSPPPTCRASSSASTARAIRHLPGRRVGVGPRLRQLGPGPALLALHGSLLRVSASGGAGAPLPVAPDASGVPQHTGSGAPARTGRVNGRFAGIAGARGTCRR